MEIGTPTPRNMCSPGAALGAEVPPGSLPMPVGGTREQGPAQWEELPRSSLEGTSKPRHLLAAPVALSP